MNRGLPLPEVNVTPRKILGPTEIGVNKLIAFAKKDDLMDFLELTGFREIERQVKNENGGKFKLRDMKKYILNHGELLERFRRSLVAARLYDTYTKRMRKTNSEKGLYKTIKQKQASKIMNVVKRKYVSYVVIRTPLEVYEEYLEEYNNPSAKYKQYWIISYNALREKQYNNELAASNNDRANVLKLSKKAKISYLPRSIREYIDKNPDHFDDYLREIKAEGKYLDAIKRAMRREHDYNSRNRMRERVLEILEEENEKEKEENESFN